MSRLGVDALDLCYRGRRYFVHAYGKSPAVERFPFSDLMAQRAQAALGDTVYLCNEQYVVKAAERGMAFGWHQDSGFIPYSHSPYLTCWVPLDDVTEANGTVYLLPYPRAGTRDVVEHPASASRSGGRVTSLSSSSRRVIAKCLCQTRGLPYIPLYCIRRIRRKAARE